MMLQTKVFRDWYSLNDPVLWVLDNQDGNVDASREPRILHIVRV